MGLFSFVGNLFGGGGGTEVSQQAKNDTNVDVTVNNATAVTVDTQAFAQSLEKVGLLAAQGQELLASGLLNLAIVQHAENVENTALVQDIWSKTQRVAIWVAGAVGIWFFFIKKG